MEGVHLFESPRCPNLHLHPVWTRGNILEVKTPALRDSYHVTCKVVDPTESNPSMLMSPSWCPHSILHPTSCMFHIYCIIILCSFITLSHILYTCLINGKSDKFCVTSINPWHIYYFMSYYLHVTSCLLHPAFYVLRPPVLHPLPCAQSPPS